MGGKLSLCAIALLTLSQTQAMNTTMSMSSTLSMSTSMYTSSVTETTMDSDMMTTETEDDSTPGTTPTPTQIEDLIPEESASEVTCDFELEATLDNGEGITIDICGFVDDDDMVAIELTLPVDRWVGVGFIPTSLVDASIGMKNAYAIIIPDNDRDGIEERFFEANGGLGLLLQDQIMLESDVIGAEARTIRFTRKLTVALEDLSDDHDEDTEGPDSYDKYYDFSEVNACGQSFQVIYAWAATPGVEVGYHDTNSGSKTLEVVTQGGDSELCEEILDAAPGKGVMMVAVVIGFVMMFV